MGKAQTSKIQSSETRASVDLEEDDSLRAPSSVSMTTGQASLSFLRAALQERLLVAPQSLMSS